MNFASDNWAGAHPRVCENLTRNAEGFAPAYGSSDIDISVERKIAEIFECDVAVFFVATGTAANSLAMALAARPGGVAFAHRDAHLVVDECGAPEFQSQLRLHPLDGPAGKFGPEALSEAMTRYPRGNVHTGQPAAVSITQPTEIGTAYDIAQIAAISSVCRQHGIPLHMDGARFANALVSLGATPAEMTWKSGVDMLSFGGTKNGCWCAEALLVFDSARAERLPLLRKRAGHLFSKSRFVAAQFDAYFHDNLWLRLARHSNEMAAALAKAVDRAPRLRLAWQPRANEVFAVMDQREHDRLKKAGVSFHPWQPPSDIAATMKNGEIVTRFVTSFATQEDEIERFSQIACR